MTDPVLNAIEKYCTPEMTVFDVGANAGVMTAAFAAIVRQVVAFEPLPACIERLKARNLPNVRIVEAAVSNEPGKTTFYEDVRPEMSGVASSLQRLEGMEEHQRPITVNVTTIDDFVAQSRLAPDFIKIDVEGFEEFVIAGSMQTIRKCQPVIIFEVWGHNWPRFADTINALKPFYRFERLSTGKDAISEYASLVVDNDDVICIPRD